MLLPTFVQGEGDIQSAYNALRLALLANLGNVDNTADLDKPVSSAQAAYVIAAIAAVVGAAPSALDTLVEIANQLAADESAAAALVTTVAGKQPLDADLTAIAALTTTTFGRSLLEAADAAALRSLAQLSIPSGGFLVFPDFPALTAATVTPAGANVVYCCHFVLRQKITVAQTNLREVAGTSLTYISWGVYDSTGNTRLIDTGPVNAATNSTKNVTLSAPVTLEPGLYWLAWTSSDATNSVVGVNLTTIFNSIGFGTGSPHCGTAANASVAGQLPTTLGTITGAAVNMPLVRLQT